MQELDRIQNHVILIAATNRLDMCDEALLRRFSIRHEVKDMTGSELNDMIHRYLNATETDKYVFGEEIAELAATYSNPGQLMPELIRLIGKRIYEEKKDTLIEEVEDEQPIDLWEVTYTWKQNVPAETEEDAIAIARRNRSSYCSKSDSEGYSAKRAEFLYPEQKK